jgi:ATPase subunit of ABC transporter with duplicated ATPase domains
MLVLQNISYTHANKNLLFENINLVVNSQRKVALIGNNVSGKSTILKMIAKEVSPSAGQIYVDTAAYYVPQVFGQYDHLTVAQGLRVHEKLGVIREILEGDATEDKLTLLDDDWTIEERCLDALRYWQLHDVILSQKMGTLSGGQKTKVLLAGISVHQPQIVLLDEPSNHLDSPARQLLYDFIQKTTCTLIVVSHDRKLLNQLDSVLELSKRGITVYGGNYEFYTEQKQIEKDALNQGIHSKEKELKKAKEKERVTLERQHKLDSHGKKKQEKAGVARIMMNTLRNKAENSTSKIKSVHAEKIIDISKELQELRSVLPDIDKMKFGFNSSLLHKGKILFKATNINFSYGTKSLWSDPLNLEILSGERIALKGLNGSGKTTLIKLMLGKLEHQTGTVYRAENKYVYIDQEYSLINHELNVYEQAQHYNDRALEEHEIKTNLNRFLFNKYHWDKSCRALGGGERMRLMLCCLTIMSESPDIIVLDEPTNNLDIQNIEILTAAISEYKGTLIVVSHDEYFLNQINTERTIMLG